MVGAGLFQLLLCKDKGSLANIQRTFINLTNFISLRLKSIADNHFHLLVGLFKQSISLTKKTSQAVCFRRPYFR